MKANITMKHAKRVGCSGVLRAGLVVCVLVLAGCATGPNANPKDPLEPLNRGVYQFNDAVDQAVLKPVATTYRDVIPSPVRTGVANFFNNAQDGWSIFNNALQLKGEATGNSLMRFLVNSLLGLGGVLDIASEMQIERSTEDFGQTMGHWGVGAGPYLMLPLLGPSTLRDTIALPVDGQGDLATSVGDVAVRNSLITLNLVNQRARFLAASAMLDQVALDPYTFTRDAFLQRRQNEVYDGYPPDDIEPALPGDGDPAK
jgi:phospholipid-binding lipoprotein MlaA